MRPRVSVQAIWKDVAMMGKCLVVLVLGCVGGVSLGSPATVDANGTDSRPLSLTGTGNGSLNGGGPVTAEILVKTVLSLILVLALGLALAWTLKRVMPRFGVRTGRRIQVLETAGLGPRRALHLVQVGSQQLLIGSTPEHVSTLTVVETGFGDVMEARLETPEDSA